MKILGIDYGRRKVGLALAEGTIAEPHIVIRANSTKDAMEKVVKVIQAERVDKIVVGLSEGEMGEESKSFSLQLSARLPIPVETFDETLSTQEAQSLAIKSGVKRSKRRKMEDAYAATIMLQGYIDNLS